MFSQTKGYSFVLLFVLDFLFYSLGEAQATIRATVSRSLGGFKVVVRLARHEIGSGSSQQMSASAARSRAFSTRQNVPLCGVRSIERYIHDSRPFNNALRESEMNHEICSRSPVIYNIDLVLRMLPALPPDTILYRIETRDQQFLISLRIGQTICSEAYYSTSRNPDFFNFAEEYSYFSTNYNVRYIIKKSFSGKSIAQFSPNRNKTMAILLDEVLFPRGSKFKVLDIEDQSGMTTVTIEEVFEGNSDCNAVESDRSIREEDFKEVPEELC